MTDEEFAEYMEAFVYSFEDAVGIKSEDDLHRWMESKGLSHETLCSILMTAYEHQEYERDILFRGIAEAIEDILKQERDHVNRSYEILRRNFRKACTLKPSPKRAEMIHQDAFDVLIFLEEEVAGYPMSERLNTFLKVAIDVAKSKGMKVPEDLFRGGENED